MRNDCKKRGHWLHMLVGLVIAAIFLAVIMWLWNLLIPDITGWSTINYWQTIGLAVLVHLLVGPRGKGKAYHFHRKHFRNHGHPFHGHLHTDKASHE